MLRHRANVSNQRATPLIELSEKSGLRRMPNRLSSQRRSELETELTKIQRYGAIQFYGEAIKGKLSGQGLDINNDPKKLVMFVAINAKIGELKTELAGYESDGRQKLMAVGVRDYPTTLRDPLPENPETLEEAFAKYGGRPNLFRKISDCALYVRGDVDKPNKTVTRGLPTMLGTEWTSISSVESGRRELADWLVSKTNPLASRSVYLPIPRNAVPESLSVFDFAEPNTVAGSREVTTVPSQALFLLNNEFVGDAARRFAERYGATDELGYEAVQDKMHIHDLHATILHLLGLDHERLTFRYAGRDFRLTDVKGVVAQKIIG